MIKNTFVLLIIIVYPAFAQEEWTNYRIDENVTIQFPGNPKVNDTPDYQDLSYDLPGMRLSVTKFPGTPKSKKRQITNTVELKLFYSAFIDGHAEAPGEAILKSDFQWQRNILTATVTHKAQGNSCNCRLLFIKRTMYHFSLCAPKLDAEYEKVLSKFYDSISIDDKLTVEDQLIILERQAFGPIDWPTIAAYTVVILFISWGLLFVVMIFMNRSGNRPPGFWSRAFAIVRWTLIVTFFVLCVFGMFVFTYNFFSYRQFNYGLGTGSIIFGVLGALALFLKPSSPSKPIL